MRSLKVILTTAGIYKRKMENLDENILAMKVLRDLNSPKFIKNDMGLF